LSLLDRIAFIYRQARWLHGAADCSNKARFGVSATRDQRLKHFNAEIYGQVEGWLGDRMASVISILGSILDRTNVSGHIAEFGVHHGLFLFLLAAIRDHEEKCFAIDVFDHQSLNIDNSGQGSLSKFLGHIQDLLPQERNFFTIVQRDTLSFSMKEIMELFEGRGVKLFSIDAGHTNQHTCNDLELMQEVLVPGGIAALDDYMSVHWPGVTEGFYDFMRSRNRRLRPFLYFQNKLFLTTLSEHALYLEQFRAEITALCGDEVQQGRWKDVEISGARCLSFA
jgi:hypothetical protein